MKFNRPFKRLKPALTNCIKALGNVVHFKQKNEVTQTIAPVPVVEEPKEDQPKDDDYITVMIIVITV